MHEGASTVWYLLNDHLGSTNVVATSSGAFSSSLRYKAWGELRYAWRTLGTDFRYTGQRMEGVGLYDYGGGTRFYDPAPGRFAQADTIICCPGSR